MPGRPPELLTSFFVAPGYSSERIHLFLARDLEPAEAEADADEAIEEVLVPLADAVAMVKDGRIEDAKSCLGILLAAERCA